MRIIGIDPGLRNTGWGIIDIKGDKIVEVANGICATKTSDNLALRLRSIFENLSKINGEFKDNELVSEVIKFIEKDKKRPICSPQK